MRKATLAVAGSVVAALGAVAVAGGGEEAAERRLPQFALASAGGGTLSVKPTAEGIEVRRGEERRVARAALLHFFQPDCNACVEEIKALQALHGDPAAKEVFVAAVAHRGGEEAVRALVKRLEVAYPVLLGQGSDLARAFARGDATVLADAAGVVRYAQVGYQEGDAKGWKENLARLLAGKPVRTDVNPRAVLAAGDAFPDVRLPSLRGGKPISLAVEEGKLTFRDGSGKEVRPKAAVGFFSRY